MKTKLPEVIISADGEVIPKPIPIQPALAGVILTLEGQKQIRIMYGITLTAIAIIRIRLLTTTPEVQVVIISQPVVDQSVVEAEAVVVLPEAQAAVETKEFCK
jgi:hypothetical protein